MRYRERFFMPCPVQIALDYASALKLRICSSNSCTGHIGVVGNSPHGRRRNSHPGRSHCGPQIKFWHGILEKVAIATIEIDCDEFTAGRLDLRRRWHRSVGHGFDSHTLVHNWWRA
jgi:hypothetical protein